jgi:hypothetical protein
VTKVNEILIRTANPKIWQHVFNRSMVMKVHNFNNFSKNKAIPLQALTGPEGSRSLKLPVSRLSVYRLVAQCVNQLHHILSHIIILCRPHAKGCECQRYL